MLQSPTVVERRTILSQNIERRLWTLLAADLMAVIWMISAGPWLDRHFVTSVITFGGHHLAVLCVAALSFWTLAVMAACTSGFTTAGRVQIAVISAASVTSMIALAGFLSVVILVVGGGLLLGAVGRLLR